MQPQKEKEKIRYQAAVVKDNVNYSNPYYTQSLRLSLLVTDKSTSTDQPAVQCSQTS